MRRGVFQTFNVSNARVGFLQLRVTSSVNPFSAPLLDLGAKWHNGDTSSFRLVDINFLLSVFFCPCCELFAWFFLISHLVSYRKIRNHWHRSFIFCNTRVFGQSHHHSFSINGYCRIICGLAKWCHVVARDRLPSFSSPEVLFEVKTHAHLFSLMIKCRPCFKLAALAFRAPFLVQRYIIVARFLLNFILLLPSDSKLVAVLCIQSLHWNSKFSGVDYGNLKEIVWLSLANRLSGWTSSPLLCKSEIAHSHCVLLHTMFISTLTVKT